MCGIIAYKGKGNAVEIVIDGLKRLEYRGYDSWGVCFKENDGVSVVKEVGRITAVKDINRNSSLCIGHTRWATNGSVTRENAHPHSDCDGKVFLVHNGIVENWQELKKGLGGHRFRSETDSEVIAHLIEEELKEKDFVSAIRNVFSRLEGRNAIVVTNGDGIVAVKKGSPLIVGISDIGYFIASDAPAFMKHTRKVVFLEDDELVSINEGIGFYGSGGNKIVKDVVALDWNAEEAEKGAYPYFLIKEIMEQNETVRRAINQSKEAVNKAAEMINRAYGVFMIGAGTAGKVALMGTYLFSRIAKKHVNFAVASEFQNYHDFITEGTLVIAISQSGETADVLEALEVAKQKGAKIMSIVNVKGSSIDRMSDLALYVNAGPERAVASTKATTGQIAVVTLLAYACAGKLEEGKGLLEKAASKINSLLKGKGVELVKGLAAKIKGSSNIYIIGRGLNYPVALEGAVKLQEVSCIHAEGIAGGELKHYALALVEEGTPCIVLVSEDENKKSILGNALEIKSRGGYIIGISAENNAVFDFWIPTPDNGVATPILSLIPMQLLAYHLALELGRDPDYCRNLAKSVTVK